MRLAGILETVKEMQQALKETERKAFVRIIWELLNYYIKNKEFPKYYFKHMVYRKNVKNYLDYYLGGKEFYNIRQLIVGDRQLFDFLENKVLFHQHFKESKLKLPNHLCYNLEKSFFLPEGMQHIDSCDGFCRFVIETIDKAGVNSIFAKPIFGIGGKDCFKIDAAIARPEKLAHVYDQIISSKYIFQESIIQHHLISAIYPHSVNTLRIHSCIRNNGKIDLISAMMKFGSKGNYVEGGGQGTTLISVDIDSGKLGPYAFKNFQWGGDIYFRHPDTDFVFEGFVIPYFEEAKEMAKSAAAFLAPYRLVGWDIAICEKELILIEGNHNFGFWAAQIADGGFKKNKIFRSFYEAFTNESRSIFP